MAIRSDYSALRRLPPRPVAAGGGMAPAVTVTPSTAPAAAPSVPEPNKSATPGVPLPDPLKATELMDALLHPIRTVKGLFNWSRNLMAFDALGPITSANAVQAEAALTGADGGAAMMALSHLFPAIARAVDKRAAAAVTQLRPSIEQGLTQRTLHGMNVVWPVGGSNLSAFKELMSFDQVFKSYPDATVQKALAGISEIDVQRLDLWDMNNPIKRQAATLFIQRPITWLPGQKPIDDSLKAYLDKASLVSASV